MRIHKQNDITPEEFEKFRVSLGLKPLSNDQFTTIPMTSNFFVS